MAGCRAVIVGCGRRARMHALAYKHVAGGHLVACCDHDAGRAAALAGEVGLASYTDAEHMIRVERPDLVHLVTMPDTRVELMTLVSDLGVPACLVEKPIAAGVRDWRALTALAASTRTRFAVGMQFRFHPHLTRCREVLAQGALGELVSLELSAGMNVANQGVHILDWAMSLNRDRAPRSVFGAASGVDRHDRGHLAPENTVARVVFEGGVEGLWTNGPAARRVVADAVTYKHSRVAACARRGRVLWEEFGRWDLEGPQTSESGEVDEQTWRALNHRAQASLTDAVLAWIADDARPAGTHLDRVLMQWNAILGLYLSALERRPVALPCDPPDDLVERLVEALE
jgi:predicted dehydrogenase